MAKQVKLLGTKRSPFNCRVEIALKLKGVEYEFVEEDLSNKSDELLKNNPVYKKIPVLVHNGKAIAESTLIVEYIDEAFEGPSILPKDPYQKANARFWSKLIDDKLVPTLRDALLGKGEEKDKAINEGTDLLKLFEKQLESKMFFGGNGIGLVDIIGISIGYWLGIYEEVLETKLATKEKFPKLTEWMHDYCNCSPVKECLPPRDVLIELESARFKKAKLS